MRFLVLSLNPTAPNSFYPFEPLKPDSRGFTMILPKIKRISKGPNLAGILNRFGLYVGNNVMLKIPLTHFEDILRNLFYRKFPKTGKKLIG